MELISQPLPPEQRQLVLAAVWNALRRLEPRLFDDERVRAPSGILALDTYLDNLVDMSRHMAADRIEPFLAAIVEDICAECPRQDATAHCPLRRQDQCVIFTHARSIIEAIDRTLHQLGDPVYLAARQRN
jgi:hypothetical protein